MNVLSLFDGMSCGHIALDRAGINIENYFASEIKNHAIKVTQYNYPDTIQLGDVKKIDCSTLPKIDLLLGGSPCQDLSQANMERKGLVGDKSCFFWEYARILKEVNPTYFLLENVEMPFEDKKIITDTLGVYPVNINSNLISAQNRNRWYWTNISGNGTTLFGESFIEQPEDKNIKLQSILENGYTDKEKANCLRTIDGWSEKTPDKAWERYMTVGMENMVFLSPDLDYKKGIRKLTILEREKLQTVPEGYTNSISFRQAVDVLGDGWTVDVVAHILKHLH